MALDKSIPAESDNQIDHQTTTSCTEYGEKNEVRALEMHAHLSCPVDIHATCTANGWGKEQREDMVL